MIKEIFARARQGYRTISFPKGKPPALTDRFRGRPRLDGAMCETGRPSCGEACVDACPTGALALDDGLLVDLGKCLFCGECVAACPAGAIAHDSDYRLAFSSRNDMVVPAAAAELELVRQLEKRMKSMFGRSLKLRVVSAGGCGACEADVNVLGTIGWDLGRFGIQYVASPRHADGMLVTGPVTKNMELALMKTWEAIPEPKLLIAIGTCAVSGGIFAGHAETLGGVDSKLKVDLYIPGCPPHPLTILDGLLRLLGRIKSDRIPPR